MADDAANSFVIYVWLPRDAPWLCNKSVKCTAPNNDSVAQGLSVLCCVGMLYLRARVQFLLCARLLFGNAHAVQLVQLIPVNPAVNLSSGNLGIPGVNLINESCRITFIKGWYIQKNGPPDSSDSSKSSQTNRNPTGIGGGV